MASKSTWWGSGGNSPIEGLYCAGVDSTGVIMNNAAHPGLGGPALTWGFYSSYTAGAHAAKPALGWHGSDKTGTAPRGAVPFSVLFLYQFIMALAAFSPANIPEVYPQPWHAPP